MARQWYSPTDTPPIQGVKLQVRAGRLWAETRGVMGGVASTHILTRRTTHVAKVMVVDDAAFMRLRACKVLQDNGHDVIQAENGAEAVKQYAEHRPDAV